jgi:hypothetical protein
MTEIINVIIQLSFDFTVFYFMGNPSNSWPYR